MIYYTVLPSPVGELTLIAEQDALIGLWFDGQQSGLTEAVLDPAHPILATSTNWLKAYFDGKNPTTQDIPVRFYGSSFQKRVWKHLCHIPYGETATYGEIAKTVAKEMGKEKMSAQAVGNAVGANPISIIVPCHRVLGAGGKITGYTGGLEKKKILLQLEHIPYK